MRVKFLSIITCLVLCCSLALVLAPPLTGPVEANPFQTLNLSFTGTSPAVDFNARGPNLQPGDELIQFTRPNWVVGAKGGGNPWGSVFTVARVSCTVSGDLTGTASMELQSVWYEWDGLPANTFVGCQWESLTVDDGHGNGFEMVGVADIDFTRVPYSTDSVANGYVLGLSGWGDFQDQILIGTFSRSATMEGSTGYASASEDMSLRRYSAAEISSAQASATSTSLVGSSRTLGASDGPAPSDEFLQFTRPNISIPKGDTAYYVEAGSTTGSGVVGSHSFDLSQTHNTLTIPGTTPSWQGWSVGKQTMTFPDGEVNAVFVLDGLGLNTSGKTDWNGYVFALSENSTGAWTGRDYYGTGNVETDGSGADSMIGTSYFLTPAAGVPTATGTGIASLVPTSGSVQNLTAVSATSPSTSLPQEAIATKPADVQFPHGLFEFRITGLADGGSATLTIILPSAVPAGAQYWKYGPTPGNHTAHWYQIDLGDNDGDNIITITLVDGGLGDDDLTPNGTIVDQGGPGWPWPSGGSGGHSAPVFPSIYIGIGAALGAGIAAYFVRRRLTAR